MPLLSPPRPLISQRVADRLSGDTRIGQLATMRAFSHSQASNGVATVTIQVEVAMFAVQGQELGEPLTGAGFATRLVQLMGDNLTLVDAQDGTILAIRNPETDTDEVWAATVGSFAQPTMLQGDFFLALRDSQPVAIGELIRQNIAQADQMGRFA